MKKNKVRYYINPNYPHTSTMSNLPADMSKEAIATMSQWIGEDAK